MIEIPGRKAIVAIGAAWLFDTPLPPPGLRDLRDEWLTAMRSMAAANVSLYVIDPVGIRPMRGYSYGGDWDSPTKPAAMPSSTPTISRRQRNESSTRAAPTTC